MNELKEYTEKMFEDIKHIDENGNEYWYARELMKVLEYKEWRKFNKVIQKAMEACNGSNYYILDHFVLEDKMVSIGSNTKRNIKDYKLSRYACYLIVQNCNPRITIIALAQTYFAIQTRKQELSDNEFITNIKLDFRSVDIGFKSEEDTLIFAKVNSNVKSGDVFENKVCLQASFKGYNLSKSSNWKTRVYKVLPLTGM